MYLTLLWLELDPIFGPGYTGMKNLGNTCYMNSVLQVVFNSRPFRTRYFEALSLKEAFDAAPTNDLATHLPTQLTKLAHGLLSGNYSTPSSTESHGSEMVIQNLFGCGC